MKNNIFISASCRYGQLVNPRPYHHQINHTHNTKDFIQYIQYVKGELDIPNDLESKIFREQCLRHRAGKPLIRIDQKKLLDEYSNSRNVISEICSQKITYEDGFIFHRLTTNFTNFKIQTNEELYNDLKIMKQIASDKKLIVCTHINIEKFPKRSLLIDTLSKYCKDLNILFLNASKLIHRHHTSDINHLNNSGYKVIEKELLRMI